LPKVKNATSYFKNGLKNRFRAIAIRADEHFPLGPKNLLVFFTIFFLRMLKG
jgi:hypothetical protein